MQLMYIPVGESDYVASNKFFNVCKICYYGSNYYFIDIDGLLYSNNCKNNDNFELVDTELKIIDIGIYGLILTSDYDVYRGNVLINTTISNIRSLFTNYIAKTVDGKYVDLYNIKCKPIAKINEPIIKHVSIFTDNNCESLFMMSDLSIGKLEYDSVDPGDVHIVPYDSITDDYDIIVNIFNDYADGSVFIKYKLTNQIRLCCNQYEWYHVINDRVYYNESEIPSLYKCNTCIAKKSQTKMQTSNTYYFLLIDN
jgi:hypothetical protein